MSGDDVHRYEMDTPFDFSDEAAEALLSGRGATGVDPSVAGLLDELRSTYRPSEPTVGHELSTFFQEPAVGRFGRSRVGFAAKAAAVIAAALAATGGLAVAGALPGPVQNAVSHAAADIGVHVPSGDDHPSASVLVVSPNDTTTTDVPTTVAPPETTTVVPERHGDVVSGVAHDATNHGCEHGRAVSAVASRGKAQTKPCHSSTSTTTTTGPQGPETTTTQPPGHSGDHSHQHGPPSTTPSGHTVPTSNPGHGSSGHNGGS
jgi:hypothetical protein